MQNPIGEADLEWILHRNCEDTEQLQVQKKTIVAESIDFTWILPLLMS